MKNIFLLIILLIINSCKGEGKNHTLLSSNAENNLQKPDSNTLNFTSIDKSSIGKDVSDNLRKELIKAFKIALEKDFERPYMWDVFLPENVNLPKFSIYKNYTIGNQEFTSYYIMIKYEDAKYEAILLISKNLDTSMNDDSSLMVFENLDSEELYKRTSKLGNNNVLDISFYKDNKEYKKLQYLITQNLFLEYFKKNNEKIDRQWGEKENMDSENGTIQIYEYQIIGNVNNHLKNGHWEERQYSFEYNKSIWLDGNYKNGIKDGEWNISPNGPVEKINVYNNGKIMKSYSP